MGEVLVRAFGCTVAARYLDDSEEMVRERHSRIEAGGLGTHLGPGASNLARRIVDIDGHGDGRDTRSGDASEALPVEIGFPAE